MINRTIIVVAGFVASVIFLGIFFTGNYSLIGLLIGFGTGLFNIQWLFRDADKAINEELKEALKIYHKSLFSRLGMVTLVVAAIGRFRPDWLIFLVLGIAGGIIIPLLLIIRQKIKRERG